LLAFELGLAGLVDLSGLERTAPGRDDHGPGLVLFLGRGDADQVLIVVSPDHRHVLALVNLRAHVIGLVDEVLTQVFAHDVRVGRVVVDRLLGVKGGELSPGHGRVEQEGRHPAHAGEERGRESGGPRSDDESVPDHVSIMRSRVDASGERHASIP